MFGKKELQVRIDNLLLDKEDLEHQLSVYKLYVDKKLPELEEGRTYKSLWRRRVEVVERSDFFAICKVYKGGFFTLDRYGFDPSTGVLVVDSSQEVKDVCKRT